jgi:hypothetical protein
MAARVKLKTEEISSKQSVGELVSEVKFLKNILHLKQSGRGVSEIIYKMKQVEEENSRLKLMLQERELPSQSNTPTSRFSGKCSNRDRSVQREPTPSIFKKWNEGHMGRKNTGEDEEIESRELDGQGQESKIDNLSSFPPLALSPISELPNVPLELDDEEGIEEEQNQTVKRFPKLQKIQIISFNKDRDWHRDQSQSFRINLPNQSQHSPDRTVSVKNSSSNRVITLKKMPTLKSQNFKLPEIKSYEKLKLKLKDSSQSFKLHPLNESSRLSPKHHFGSSYKSTAAIPKGGLRISRVDGSLEGLGHRLEDLSQSNRNHTLWSDKFRTLSKERTSNRVTRATEQDSKLSKFLKELARLKF